MIFISYQSNDKARASHLEKLLQEADIFGWKFDKDLMIGDEWKRIIDTNIKDAAAVIVIVTLGALKSQYVTYEWAFALGYGKRVIPLIFELPDPTNPEHPPMHPRLEDYQYANTLNPDFTWEAFVAAIQALERQEEKPIEIINAERDLTSTDPRVRKMGVESLFAHEHPSSILVLVKAVGSGYLDVSREAGIALAIKSNYENERALPGLAKAVDFYDTMQRALNVLAQMDTPAAVKTIVDFIDRRPNDHRDLLAKPLARMTNASVLPVIRRLIRQDGFKFDFLVDALGRFGDPQAIPELMEYFNELGFDQNAAMRERIILIIGKIGGREAIDALYQILYNYAPHYVNYNRGYTQQLFDRALDELMKLDGTYAVEVLERAIKEDRFSRFRQILQQSIAVVQREMKTQR